MIFINFRFIVAPIFSPARIHKSSLIHILRSHVALLFLISDFIVAPLFFPFANLYLSLREKHRPKVFFALSFHTHLDLLIKRTLFLVEKQN